MTSRRCSVVELEIEKKLEKRYDEEVRRGTHRKVLEWINNCLVNEYELLFCGSYSWRDIQRFLEDGVILCRLMNRFLVQAGHPRLDYRKQKPKRYNDMVWMENAALNVEMFNEGMRMIGVPDMYMIEVADLLNGRKGHMFNIVVSLHKLGLVANERKFTPAFERPKNAGRKLSIINMMTGKAMLEFLPQLECHGEQEGV